MNRSEDITSLVAALLGAHKELKAAPRTAENTYFSTKWKRAGYAPLEVCIDTYRETFAKHGLVVVQSARSEYRAHVDYPATSKSDAERLPTGDIHVETMLVHTSGQYISDTLTIYSERFDVHGIGGAITYARRYGLCALAGIASEDDDGNIAKGVEPPSGPVVRETPPAPAPGTKSKRDRVLALAKRLRPDLEPAASIKSLKAAVGIDPNGEATDADLDKMLRLEGGAA